MDPTLDGVWATWRTLLLIEFYPVTPDWLTNPGQEAWAVMCAGRLPMSQVPVCFLTPDKTHLLAAHHQPLCPKDFSLNSGIPGLPAQGPHHISDTNFDTQGAFLA